MAPCHSPLLGLLHTLAFTGQHTLLTLFSYILREEIKGLHAKGYNLPSTKLLLCQVCSTTHKLHPALLGDQPMDYFRKNIKRIQLSDTLKLFWFTHLAR